MNLLRWDLAQYCFCLVLLGAGGTAGAAVYRCSGSDGVDVYTDSPLPSQACSAATESMARNGEPVGQPAADNTAATDAAGSRPDGAPPITVPLQRVGHLFVVDAIVDGQRHARLIVDTGASHTLLSKTVVRDLGYHRMEAISPPAMLNTAAGPVAAQLIRAGSIRLSSADIYDIQVAVHDLPDAPDGVEGLLGMNVLGQFLVTLDADKAQLRLQRRE
jgi:clan AA aspartic protease (TIGR02281 family)